MKKTGRKPGRPAHKPTGQTRKKVREMAAVGCTHQEIGLVIGVCDKTLRKCYKSELDTALAEANAAISARLYKKAMAGDVASLIWWEKTRQNRSDRKKVEHEGELAITEIKRKIVK